MFIMRVQLATLVMLVSVRSGAHPVGNFNTLDAVEQNTGEIFLIQPRMFYGTPAPWECWTQRRESSTSCSEHSQYEQFQNSS